MSETTQYRCSRCETTTPGHHGDTCRICEDEGVTVVREPVAVLPAAELAALRRGPWVPCAERMPRAGAVLVTMHHGDGVGVRELSWSGEQWWDGHVVLGRDSTVVAWMPLPKPYAERRADRPGKGGRRADR